MITSGLLAGMILRKLSLLGFRISESLFMYFDHALWQIMSGG